jgi:hypothetical protein
MTVPPPKIDQRTNEEIVDYTAARVEAATGWVRPQGQPDAGLALVRLFAYLARGVGDRINQTPEKNFPAFLDLIGTEIQPPQAARVPLTFALAAGTTADAFVPAHTQVAAPPQENETEAVVYETERELVVTPAVLTAVAVRDPQQDLVSDYTAIATGQTPGAFPAFEAIGAMEHSLYLANDELLTGPGAKTVTVTFTTAQAAAMEAHKDHLHWEIWDGESWRAIAPVRTAVPAGGWQAIFDLVAAPQPTTIDGVSAAWLRLRRGRQRRDQAVPAPGQIANGPTLDGTGPMPTVTKIEITVTTSQTAIAPDRCLANTVPLDLSKDFYPFGEQPRFNDTFYIACDRALSQPGSTVTVEVTPTDGLPIPANASPDLALVWEVWTDEGWKKVSDPRATPPAETDGEESSGTYGNESPPAAQPTFTETARIPLTLPSDIATTTLNGEIHHWLRVRIARGNYGEAAKVTANDEVTTNAAGQVVFSPATFAPPSLGQITLAATHAASGSPTHLCTCNDFAYSDPQPAVTRTLESYARSGQRVKTIWLERTAGFAEGDRLRLGQNVYTIATLYRDSPGLILTPEPLALPAVGERVFHEFALFQPSGDRRPTLYLGFDRPFAQRPMTLYAQVAHPDPDEASRPASVTRPPAIAWEFFGPQGWQPLAVNDDSRGFSRRGLIQFVGPRAMVPRADLGQGGQYWLRARWQSGEFRLVPRLHRLLTNTTWASQSQTLTAERLGSSNGNPDQRFQTSQRPVLRGAKLEVQEEASLGAALAPTYDDTGQLREAWVQWQAVPNFYGSGPRDRHYVLDALTGEIRFGNGRQGLIPPLGRNNLRLHYRTGGGAGGDRPAHTIIQLQTTIPSVDSVTNREPAGGGAPQESLAQVQARGPTQLRHRDRAVAAQDFADLAFAASPEVARAIALTPQFEPLETDAQKSLWLEKPDQPQTQLHAALANRILQVVVVPHSDAAQPVPSLGLLDQVEDYLRQRCLPTVAIAVRGPAWVQVTVTATVAVESFEGSDAVRTALVHRLNRFLHCLTGGRSAQGWDFGRQPQRSDLYALIEAVPGVAWVPALALTLDPPAPDRAFLIYPGPHQITLTAP